MPTVKGKYVPLVFLTAKELKTTDPDIFAWIHEQACQEAERYFTPKYLSPYEKKLMKKYARKADKYIEICRK